MLLAGRSGGRTAAPLALSFPRKRESSSPHASECSHLTLNLLVLLDARLRGHDSGHAPSLPRCVRSIRSLLFLLPQRTSPERTSSEGVARRKAQSYGIRIRCRTRRAPFGAPASAQAARSAIAQTKDSAPRSAPMRMLICDDLRTTGPRFRRKYPACDPRAVSDPPLHSCARRAPREK
jgi:hypothetical protein